MKLRLAVLGLVLAATTVFAPIGPASAAEVQREEHCSVTVIGQKPSGEFLTTPPVCAPSPEEARALDQTAPESSLASILAIHYTSSNFGGNSLTVNGTNCNGGWANMSGANLAFNNQIVSTRNMLCGRTAHYDSFDKVGFLENHYSSEVNLTNVCCVSSVSYNP